MLPRLFFFFEQIGTEVMHFNYFRKISEKARFQSLNKQCSVLMMSLAHDGLIYAATTMSSENLGRMGCYWQFLKGTIHYL